MKKLIFTLLLATSLYSASAQTLPQYVTTVEGIREYKLDNGLKILLLPDASQSNTVINIVYNVGSRHEGYGEKGMAHLLEHMLFKSTKKLGDIKSMLSDKGGQANGTTWLDRTNYYEVFPASDENLKWFLEMEADRMINATILQSDLDKEFSVVRNEFEIGENSPERVLMERVMSTAYLWHNYGNSTIGSREDIERVKADRLRVFYEKYYQPDNAILMVAGKFDEKKAIEYIKDYFSVIPKPTRVLEKTYTVEPAQDGERYVDLKRTGDNQSLAALYHTAAYADEDYAALSALTEILTSDPSGYLYKSLVDTQIGTSIFAWSPTLRDPGFMYFGLSLSKEKDINSAKKVFVEELNKIAAINYSEQDLARAKTKLLKNFENLQNNTIGFTIELTEIIGAGDYKLAFLYRDAVEKLTLEDIKRVAKKYFITNNRTLGTFSPSDDISRIKPKEILDEDIQTLTKNYIGKALEDNLEEFEASITNIQKNLTTHTLKNGLKYAVLNKPIKGKKVSASFSFPMGTEATFQNKAWTKSLLASLIKSGTKTKTKEQIQDQLDQLKSSLGFSFGHQSLDVNINTYEENFEEVMMVLKDLLTNATFPENEFTKSKEENKTYLEAQKNDPQSIIFSKILSKTSQYPKGHLFYSSTIDEDIEALNNVKLSDIKELYKNLGSNFGFGTIVGKLDKNKISKSIENTFQNWNTQQKYIKATPTYFNTKFSSEKINTPDKENGAVIALMNIEMDSKSADYPALVMVDAILGSGGFLTARIPTRLRENEGISYGAGSSLEVAADHKAASWFTYAFFNPKFQEKVDEAIKDEIKKALKNGFTQEELDNNKKSWLAGRETTLGNNGYLASNLINKQLSLNIPLSDFDKLNQHVKNLTLEQVNAALKKYIDPDKLVYVYAGDFDKK